MSNLRTLGSVLLLTIALLAVGGQRFFPVPPAEILPVETGSVPACCPSIDLGPGGDELVEHEPPEMSPFSAAEKRAIRRQARWTPDAPVGIDLSPPASRPVTGSRSPTEAIEQRRPPRLRKSFDGLNQGSATTPGSGVIFSSAPPDAMISASTSTMLHATNGGLMLLPGRRKRAADTANPNAFFGVEVEGGGAQVLFDPKTVFDHRSGRFILSYLFRTEDPERSFFYIAVSRDDRVRSFDDGDWCKYRMRGKAGNAWSDYQSLGLDENFLVITTNNFDFDGNYSAAWTWVIDRTELTANDPGSCPKLRFSRFRLPDDDEGRPIFTVQPANHLDDSHSDGLLMMSTQPLTRSDDYLLWRVEPRDAPGPRPKARIIRVHALAREYMPPPMATQQDGGTDLDAGDMRVTQAVVREGRLYFVFGLTCAQGEAPNEACVRVVRVAAHSDLESSVVESEIDIGAGPDTHLFWPAVAVNEGERLVVVALRSGASSFLGTVYAHSRPNGESFAALESLADGNRISLCGSSEDRTGDYVAAVDDPRNRKGFVIVGQYADENVSTFSTGCRWNTRIGVVR